MKQVFTVLFALTLFVAKAQEKAIIRIGILADSVSKQELKYLPLLKEEIKKITNEEYSLVYNEILYNGNDATVASRQYDIISKKSDIILCFDLHNAIMLNQRNGILKPTIAIANINNDIVERFKNVNAVKKENLNFLIAPYSYKNDLNSFKELYKYTHIAILADEITINSLPLKEVFDSYFELNGGEYELVSVNDENLNSVDLQQFDAVYIATDALLDSMEFEHFIGNLNSNKIPSFSASYNLNFRQGVLATKQSKKDIRQFFKQTALNIDAIQEGEKPGELPNYLDVDQNLTININTVRKLGLHLKYSMLGKTQFIGGESKYYSSNTVNLPELMRSLLNENVSLKSSRKDIDLSNQEVKLSKSNYLPNVEASSNGIYVDPNLAEKALGQQPEYSSTGDLMLEQLIFSESANADISIKKNIKEAQKHKYSIIELDLLEQAAETYFNALIQKTNMEILYQNMEVTKSNLNIANQKYKLGTADKADVLRFKSQLAQNTQELISADSELKNVLRSINILLNREVDAEVDIEDANLQDSIFKKYNYEGLRFLMDEPTLRPGFTEFLVEQALKNSPELKNLMFNKFASERSYKLNKKGKWLPTVALQANYNRTLKKSGKGSKFPDGYPEIPNDYYNIALNVSMPIFQRNQRNINRRTAQIQLDQIADQKVSVNQNIEYNVYSMVQQLVTEIANIELYKVAEGTAEEGLMLTQHAYSIGNASVVEMIDAQTNFLQAKQASAIAIYNYLLASLKLERSIGYFLFMKSPEENQRFIQDAQNYVLKRGK